MAETALEHRIAQMVEPALAAMAYELVRIQISGRGGRTLQIMAERADRAPMTVEDCTAIAHAVSPLLDVEDPISGAYGLEVSSPGIDRPLVRAVDFERFAGREAKLETRVPVDGRRRFRGRLRGIEAGRVRIELPEGGEAALPVESIEKAKLVMSDEVIAAALHARKA